MLYMITCFSAKLLVSIFEYFRVRNYVKTISGASAAARIG